MHYNGAMSQYFAIVPAAGSGSRMGQSTPKQYSPLLGKPLIWHTLSTLCDHPSIAQVYVVLSPSDTIWASFDWSAFNGRLTPLYCGGEQRADSVRNALRVLHGPQHHVREDDWVMVHDAARACLSTDHLNALIQQLGHDDVGGLLAVPVADTVKRADSHQRCAETVPRDGLWQAQTPQMFRYAVLRGALDRARNVTDEASAVEAVGLQPKLVAADMTNLKVTWPLDLHMAELILRDRKDQA